MRALMLLLALLAPGANAASLEEALVSVAPGSWIEYQAPLQAGGGSPCCIDWNDGNSVRHACALDGRQWNFGTDADRSDTLLRVFVRRGPQGADRIRALGASCPVAAGTAQLATIDGVDAASAANWIATQLPGLDPRDRDTAVAALALHGVPAATDALARLAAPGNSTELRRQSLFWLGAARGAEGLPILRRTLAQETNAALLSHTVFSLSQCDAPAARRLLRETARVDRRMAVRGEALFWLAQDEDPQTEALAHGALAESQARGLREKAVFALSQLPAGRAVPALEALARDRGQDARTRRDALFWLAQQDDDDAFAVFDELLGNAPRQ